MWTPEARYLWPVWPRGEYSDFTFVTLVSLIAVSGGVDLSRRPARFVSVGITRVQFGSRSGGLAQSTVNPSGLLSGPATKEAGIDLALVYLGVRGPLAGLII
jgi:hypothetical protein